MNKYLFLEAITKAGFKGQRDFAEKVGVSYKILNNHINGVTKVSTEDAARYCLVLKLEDDEKIVQIFLPSLSANKDEARGEL